MQSSNQPFITKGQFRRMIVGIILMALTLGLGSWMLSRKPTNFGDQIDTLIGLGLVVYLGLGAIFWIASAKSYSARQMCITWLHLIKGSLLIVSLLPREKSQRSKRPHATIRSGSFTRTVDVPTRDFRRR